MSPHRAHAVIEAAQPWYSLGLVFLSLGLLADRFAPPFELGAVDLRDFGVGLLVGLGMAMQVAVLLRWRQTRRERADDA